MSVQESETDHAPASGSIDSSLMRSKQRFGDTLFKGISTTAGLLILAILAGVATFLIIRAVPGVTGAVNETGLTEVKDLGGFWNWVLPLLFGTVWAAFLAMLVAVPMAIGVALFLSHYAPKALAKPFGYIIDLLAAVPSVVFGVWGIYIFAPMLGPVYRWLHEHMSWFPPFNANLVNEATGEELARVALDGRTVLTAALVLALMVLPIICALCREVFQQTPRLHEEASLALGATRWEMIRQAVLPFGIPGIISACMLGLGRALGETMAVAMILSGQVLVSIKLLTYSNPDTIAATIAKSFAESSGGDAVHQLIGAGLVLFILTLVVNMIARWIISSRKEFSGAN